MYEVNDARKIGNRSHGAKRFAGRDVVERKASRCSCVYIPDSPRRPLSGPASRKDEADAIGRVSGPSIQTRYHMSALTISSSSESVQRQAEAPDLDRVALMQGPVKRESSKGAGRAPINCLLV